MDILNNKYFYTIGPILGAQLLLPPIYSSKSSVIPISTNTLTKYLAFSERNLKSGKLWTALTYILLNQNIDQRRRNVIGIIQSGVGSFQLLGPLHWYLCLLGGALVGISDRILSYMINSDEGLPLVGKYISFPQQYIVGCDLALQSINAVSCCSSVERLYYTCVNQSPISQDLSWVFDVVKIGLSINQIQEMNENNKSKFSIITTLSFGIMYYLTLRKKWTPFIGIMKKSFKKIQKYLKFRKYGHTQSQGRKLGSSNFEQLSNEELRKKRLESLNKNTR
eukprot:NODE_5973_length_944_cov_36.884287_g5385_i0.p1 GENE.NODE_5973_length_944_cov_36.884287_g5385_i0~~NODE_5973_length_944_cov_36.884287_g5385_i0.p1  ORF type:complete len:279 (-),score=40.65 NODE_5973_length_944_cov_36.884287_g5385_i0:49-885(-)